ncbi:MAG: T9SS type A sorting domain-containing protein [Bacteroidales bacterium]|nr:T9SS type A sorting domain-containing protein [Bacteroidales bacterium]
MKILFATLLLASTFSLAKAEEVASRSEEKETVGTEVTANLESQKVLETEDKDAIEVYNLCGQLVSNSMDKLSKGVYIVKQNGTSRKVVIR